MKTTLGLLVGCALMSAVASAGTWGAGTFENDAALDWLENELKPDGLRAVERAVATVLKSSGYLEADTCCAAIAACEVLAAAQGRRGRNLSENGVTLAKRLPAKPPVTLRAGARKALDKILADSELRDLWAESKGLLQWEMAVRQLQSRL